MEMASLKITQAQVDGLIAALGAQTASISAVTAANTALQARLDALEAGYQTVRELTITGGVLTIDLAGARTDFQVSHTANITSIVYQNFPAAGTMKTWTIRFIGTGTARTIAWPTTAPVTAHNGGTAPTIASTTGKVTTITQYTTDGGTKVHTFKGGET